MECCMCRNLCSVEPFVLDCGCVFHEGCLKYFSIYRTVQTCPNCAEYLSDRDAKRLKDAWIVASDLEEFHRAKKNEEEGLRTLPVRTCVLCRRTFAEKPYWEFRLDVCEHVFHGECLKKAGVLTQCPVCEADIGLMNQILIEYADVPQVVEDPNRLIML